MIYTEWVFPNRLKHARLVRGLKQEELAERMGHVCVPSMISNYETGTRTPGARNLLDLADALDVSADYLLGRSDEM